MSKIIGNTVGIPNPISDWNQTNSNKADYIKNKPQLSDYQKKFDDETLECIKNLGNMFDRVASNTLSLTQKQSKLSEEQLANIDKVPSIEQTAIGADVTAQMAMQTAGSAYDRTVALESGKQDKVTVFQDTTTGISYDFKFADMYNCEYQIKSALANVSFTFGTDAYPNDYMAGLSFGSGDTPTTVSYVGTGILNWVGTDCTISEGYSIFQPSANTHYDIVFYFNGTQMIGLVNGFVPASGNVVSE